MNLDAIRLRIDQLLVRGDGREAERAAREGLAIDPRDRRLRLALAIAYLQQERPGDALDEVDRLVADEGPDPWTLCLRARTLVLLDRPQEALETAEQAVLYDPIDPDARAEIARAHLAQGRTAEAIEASRQALAFDPSHELAGLFLAEAHRRRGEYLEAESVARGVLAAHPEGVAAHVAAGWIELSQGRVRPAKERFHAALRLDPTSEAAREGMLEAHKADSAIYRQYIRYSVWMARRSPARQIFLVLGLWAAARGLSSLELPGGWRYVGLGIGLVLTIFFFWTWFADGIACLLVLRDRLARHALRPSDRAKAIFVGAFSVLGIGFVLAGILGGWEPLLGLGLGFFASTFPHSLAIGNRHPVGRRAYAAVAWAALGCGLAFFAAALIGVPAQALSTMLLPLIFLPLATSLVALTGWGRRG